MLKSIEHANTEARRLFLELDGDDGDEPAPILEEDQGLFMLEGFEGCPDMDAARTLLALAYGYPDWNDLEARVGRASAPRAPEFVEVVNILHGARERMEYDRNAAEIAMAARPIVFSGDLRTDVATILDMAPLAMPARERLLLAKDVMTTVWVAAAKGTDAVELVCRIMLKRGTEADRADLKALRESMMNGEVRSTALQAEMMREQDDVDNDAGGIYAMFGPLRDGISRLGIDGLAELMLVPIAQMAAWGGAVDQRSLLIVLLLDTTDHLGDGPYTIDLAA